MLYSQGCFYSPIGGATLWEIVFGSNNKNFEKSHETELNLQKQHIKQTKIWSFLLPTVPLLAVFQQ